MPFLLKIKNYLWPFITNKTVQQLIEYLKNEQCPHKTSDRKISIIRGKNKKTYNINNFSAYLTKEYSSPFLFSTCFIEQLPTSKRFLISNPNETLENIQNDFTLIWLGAKMGLALKAQKSYEENEELTSYYNGIYYDKKSPQKPTDFSYLFRLNNSTFIDPKHIGNETRFMCHANLLVKKIPIVVQEKAYSLKGKVLQANLKAEETCLTIENRKLTTKKFSTLRKIKKGELLLYDYGKKYFREKQELFIIQSQENDWIKYTIVDKKGRIEECHFEPLKKFK